MLACQPGISLGNLREDSCAFSALHHGSMTKRTAVAAEVMRGESSERKTSHAASLELVDGREEKAAKRQEILERAGRRRVRFTKDMPPPFLMLSKARDERDEDFGRTIEEVKEVGL